MSVCGHLGFYNTSSTRTHVRFQFPTFAASGSSVAPSSAYEAADIRIYRAADGAAFSATQRSSANGITMTSPFDSLTGFHDVDIDLTDNTDAGFFAAGYFYSVVLAADETVDSQTINGVVLCTFEIGVAPVNVTQFGGTAGTFSSGRPEVNASHWGGTAVASALVRGNLIQIEGLDASDIFDGLAADHDAISAAIGALNDIAPIDVWTYATRVLTAGTNISLAKGTGVTGFNDLDAAGVRSAVGLASANLDTQIDALPTAAENADAIWDEATAGHTTAGTYGKAVSDVLADTNELQVDWVNGGRLDLLLDSAVSNSGTLLTDWTDGGRLDLLLDATLADTNELQQDWVNGGRLDNILDARASQTSVNTIDDLLDNEIGDLTTAVAAISSALAVVDGNVDSILLDTGTDGVALSAAAVDAIHDEPITEPSSRPAWASMTHRKIQQTLGVLMLNELDSDGNSVDVRNDADDATLWSYPSSDDGSTYISGKAA